MNFSSPAVHEPAEHRRADVHRPAVGLEQGRRPRQVRPITSPVGTGPYTLDTFSAAGRHAEGQPELLGRRRPKVGARSSSRPTHRNATSVGAADQPARLGRQLHHRACSRRSSAPTPAITTSGSRRSTNSLEPEPEQVADEPAAGPPGDQPGDRPHRDQPAGRGRASSRVATNASGLVLPNFQQTCSPVGRRDDARAARQRRRRPRPCSSKAGYVMGKRRLLPRPSGKELSRSRSPTRPRTPTTPRTTRSSRSSCARRGIDATFDGQSVDAPGRPTSPTGNFQLDDALVADEHLALPALQQLAQQRAGDRTTRNGNFERLKEPDVDATAHQARPARPRDGDQLKYLAPIEQYVATATCRSSRPSTASRSTSTTRSKFTGWPSASNPYESGSPNAPTNEVVVLHLKPTQLSSAPLLAPPRSGHRGAERGSIADPTTSHRTGRDDDERGLPTRQRRRARFPPGFLWGARPPPTRSRERSTTDGRGPLDLGHVQPHAGEACAAATRATSPATSTTGSTRTSTADRASAWTRYRFSIAWPRVQPTGRGPVNQRGLDFYRALVDGLRRRGIMPAVTLYHWDLPQALEDEGGWANRDTADRFAEYAEIVRATRSATRSGMWITLNEPQVVAHQGYRIGTHAPGQHRRRRCRGCGHPSPPARHGLALQALRAQLPARGQVGISLDLHPIRAVGERRAPTRPRSPTPSRTASSSTRSCTAPTRLAAASRTAAAAGADPAAGDMELISAPIDFLGVNYYSPALRPPSATGCRPAAADETPHRRPPGRRRLPARRSCRRRRWAGSIEPDGLYDTLCALDARRRRACRCTSPRTAAPPEDYVDPDGQSTTSTGSSTCRPFRRGLARDRRRRQPRRLLRLVAAGQLRVGLGLPEALRPVFVDFATQRRMPKRSAAFLQRIATANALPGG